MDKYKHYVLTPKGFLAGVYTTNSEAIGPDETRAPYPDDSGLYRYSRKNMRWYPCEDDSIFMEEQRNLLRQKVAEIRWEKQTGGFKTPANMYVRTDEESIADITFLAACAQDDQKITYKAINGYYDLMGDQVRALLSLAHAHVQTCFDNDKRLSDLIGQCTTLEELDGINVNEGWPTTLPKDVPPDDWEPEDPAPSEPDSETGNLPDVPSDQQVYKPQGEASDRLKELLENLNSGWSDPNMSKETLIP